jgi:hypothetical protein
MTGQAQNAQKNWEPRGGHPTNLHPRVVGEGRESLPEMPECIACHRAPSQAGREHDGRVVARECKKHDGYIVSKALGLDDDKQM